MVPSTAINRVELGSTYQEYDLAMSRNGFIGNKVLKTRMSAVQQATVPLVPIEALLQSHSTKRAANGTYPRGQWEWTSYSFSTEEFGWEEPIDERTLKIYRNLIEAERIASDRATDFVCREYEQTVAAAVFNATTWTGAALTTAVAVEWDTFATAVPTRNVKAAHKKIKLSSGMKPNALIIQDDVLRNLTECDSIVDRIKYSGRDDPKNVTAVIVADLFMVDQLLVGSFALKNTANPKAAASLADIWDDEYAMLAKLAVTDDPQETCIGRTIMWSEESAGPGGDDGIAVTMEEYRDEDVRGNVMRARTDYTTVIIHVECGHLLSNITT